MTVENENGEVQPQEPNPMSIRERGIQRAKEHHEARVAGDALRDDLEKAIDSGKYLVAIYRLDGDQVLLDFRTHAFPTGDFPLVVKMLRDEIQKAVKAATLKGIDDDGPTQQSPLGG